MSDEVRQFYDDFTDYQLTFIKKGNARLDAIHRRLQPLIRERRPASALDIGCGIGLTMRWLTRLVPRVVGVDISPRSVRAATEIAPEAHAVALTIPQEPFAVGRFDLVIMLDVLEHFPPTDRLRVFERIDAAISDDAVLVVNVPSKLFARAHAEDATRQVIDEALGADEIVQLAAGLGMEPLHVERYGIEFANQYVFLAFGHTYDVRTGVRPSLQDRARALPRETFRTLRRGR